MDKVIFTVVSGKATVSAGRRDDDWADRLNSRYSPLIFIVATVFVTIQQIVRNPITCWAPVHFTKNHIKYANNYCWIRNTYYLPFDEVHLPHEGEDRQLLRYYQYIQFVLIGQAMCFYLPTLIWRAFNSKAGVDADNILQTALTIPDIKKADKRDNTVRFLSSQIDRFLESRDETQDRTCQCDAKHMLSGLLCRCCGRRIGNYLVILYMFQKLLFLTNIVLQFVTLGLLFGEQFWVYGAKMVADPIPDDQWTARGFVAFPRVTLCDFKVRRLGNLHRYTLQCVLPLNLFIEKMYIFIWFWMILVMAVTVFYIIIWSIRFLWRKERYNFVKNHLDRQKKLETIDAREDAHDFVDDYLRQDGAFILRLIATNTNYVSTGDIIGGLWDYWCEKTDRKYDTPSQYDTTASDEKPLLQKPHNHHGLKWRKKKKKPDEPEPLPKKIDLSRAPTLYVRGSDTLDRRKPRPSSYPDDNSDDWDEPKQPSQSTPQSSEGSLPTKEDIPMDDFSKEDPNKAQPLGSGPGTGGLYPKIFDQSPSAPVPQPRVMPSAPPETIPPKADVEDTEV